MKKLVFFAVMAVMLVFSGCVKEKQPCEIGNYGEYAIYNESDCGVSMYVNGTMNTYIAAGSMARLKLQAGTVTFTGKSDRGTYTWSDYIIACEYYSKRLGN